MVSFFEELPEEVEESGKIDGATEWQLFTRLVLPLVLPGIAAIAMLSFLYAWNEYTYSVILTRSPSNYTIPLALAVLNTEDNVTNFGLVAAGGVSSFIPVAVFVIFAQNYLTASLTACGSSARETVQSADSSTETQTNSAMQTENSQAQEAAPGETAEMTLILRGGSYAEVIKKALPDFEADHNCKIEVLEMSFDDLHTGIALDAVNETGTYDLWKTMYWLIYQRWDTSLMMILFPTLPESVW